MTKKTDSAGLDLNRRHRPVLFVSGYAVYTALTFIFPFLMTYAIHSKSEYARLTVYINWLGMLVDAGNLGLGRALQQLAIQCPEEDLRTKLARPLQGALAVLGAILAVLTAGFAAAALARPAWFEGRPWIAFWLWLAIVLGLSRLCLSFLIYGLRRYRWYIGIDVGWAVARLAVVPLSWRLAGLEGALAGNALLFGASLAVSVGVVAASGVRPAWGAWRRAFAEIRYFLKLGFWMHLTWLAPTLARPAVVLLLAWTLGRSQAPVGMAHLSFSVLTAAAILLDSFFMSLYPEKARAGVEGRRGQLAAWANEEARALGFLLWPAAVAAAWLTALPVRFLPGEYRDLAAWLAPIALALPARAMAAPLITALQAGHRPAVGAFYQLLRLACDLAGIALSLRLGRGEATAPAWGILAGEWTATTMLFVIQGITGSADAPSLKGNHGALPMLRALALIALIAAWTAGLERIIGNKMAPTAFKQWGIWLAASVGWYLATPLLGITSWQSVGMTFNPHRGE